MTATRILCGYPIVVAAGALRGAAAVAREHVNAHRWAIITDHTVGALYGEQVARGFGDAELIEIPPGEAHKTRETWATVTDRLLTLGLGRDAAIVALGGGVVGDLAGFVAATYLRGIPFVQIPTTLLAMIDASIGGKTGVDTSAGKNLVGAFHRPSAVIVDPSVLTTLPSRDLRAGLAEAIKHAVISDADYFDRLIAALPTLTTAVASTSPEMLDCISTSIGIKAAVVDADEREGGIRKTLNFGHTLGHAIETLSDYTLRHGEAIAIGMALESTLAVRLGVAERGTAHRIREALQLAQLPVSVPEKMPPRMILDLTHHDKKVRGGRVEYALPSRIGAMAGSDSGWSTPVDDAEVLAVLEGSAGA